MKRSLTFNATRPLFVAAFILLTLSGCTKNITTFRSNLFFTEPELTTDLDGKITHIATIKIENDTDIDLTRFNPVSATVNSSELRLYSDMLSDTDLVELRLKSDSGERYELSFPSNDYGSIVLNTSDAAYASFVENLFMRLVKKGSITLTIDITLKNNAGRSLAGIPIFLSFTNFVDINCTY